MFVLFIVIFFGLIVYKIYFRKSIEMNLSKNNGNQMENRFKDCPQFYPNGWLPVLESRDLKKSQVKAVFAFGNDLVVFRGVSGKVYVLDAYCPHLGANLGVGGTVIGEDIRCPFHGWKFNNSGKCTEVPGIEVNNTPKAQIKVWDSLEVNGFIYLWNHINKEEPTWVMPQIEVFKNKEFVYFTRKEKIANCHLQMMIENNADALHFNQIHTVPDIIGSFLPKSGIFDLILKYFYISYESTYKTCPEPFASMLEYYPVYHLGPFELRSFVKVKVLGAATSYSEVYIFGKLYVQSYCAVISVGPVEHRIIHHFYAKRFNPISYILAKYSSIFFAYQVDRDIEVFDSSRFLKNPVLAKNESSFKIFRRWYKQFYSES